MLLAPTQPELVLTALTLKGHRQSVGASRSLLPAYLLLPTAAAPQHTSKSWASSKISAMVSPARIRRVTLLLDSRGGSFSQRLGQEGRSSQRVWAPLQGLPPPQAAQLHTSPCTPPTPHSLVQNTLDVGRRANSEEQGPRLQRTAVQRAMLGSC